MNKEKINFLFSIGIDINCTFYDDIVTIDDNQQLNKIISTAENDFGTINKDVLKIRVTDELEAIGIITHERKIQRDKEEYASATQGNKIKMIAKRLGLISNAES